MELPPVRLPVMRNLLQKTLLRIRWYLWEAVPLFLVGTALLFVLDRTGLLGYVVTGGRPVVSGLLGLPAESAQVFLSPGGASRRWRWGRAASCFAFFGTIRRGPSA